MYRHLIELGDIVCVNFNNVQYTLVSRGEVIDIPCATGQSWIIQDTHGVGKNKPKLHYISEGCTITLLEKKPQ